MHEWHRQTIENLKNQLEADKRFLALSIVGSVARGEATEGSDLDFVLVATEDEYAKQQAGKNLFYTADDFTNDKDRQAGGYIIDFQFLLDGGEQEGEIIRADGKTQAAVRDRDGNIIELYSEE